MATGILPAYPDAPRHTGEILAAIDSLAEQLVNRAARSAENADLAGESGSVVYRSIQQRFGRIAARTRRDLTELRTHRHDWNASDYCNVCGADGRA